VTGENLFRRLDTRLLYRPFFVVVHAAVERARARGCEYWATYGLRTYEEQAELYRAWKAGKGGRAGPPGLSAHQYGLAVDLVADADEGKAGLQPDWRRPEYDVLGEEVQRVGLVWGSSFNDCPHVQWPGYLTAKQLLPLRAYVASYGEAKGLPRIWAVLDAERESLAWQQANPLLAAEVERLGFTRSTLEKKRSV
jgi:peptidoglycan LD-endopeptidase CwlK